MNKRSLSFKIFSVLMAVGVAVGGLLVPLGGAQTGNAQGDAPTFDRGLPTANLNSTAGANRSNVAWSNDNTYRTGDTFSLGSTGQLWTVTKIRVWTVAGTPTTSKLGDLFSDVSLYGAPTGQTIAPIASGTLTTGSNADSNSNILHTQVTYSGGANYQGSSGAYSQIWQHDFNNLNWVVPGGTAIYFSVDGTARDTTTTYWFNHASNAALSGSTQQGADGTYYAWLKTNLATANACQSEGPIDPASVCNGGWDKNSDLNVQVWAEQLPVPTQVYVNASWTGTSVGTDPDGSGPAMAFGYDAFATIQGGVNAVAPSGTVHVAAGTYDEENIVISKGLTLQGASAASTKIAPSTPTNDSTIVVQNPSGDVKVDGFTFVMQPKPNYGAAVLVTGTTIGVDSATVTLSNNVVQGSNDGTKSDFGFYGQNDNAKLVITGNEIDRTGDNPIVMENQLGSTLVSDNVFRITASPDYDAYFSMAYGGNSVTTPQIVEDNTFYLDHSGSGYSEGITFDTAVLNAWRNINTDTGHYSDIQVKNNVIHTGGPSARGIGLVDLSSATGNGTITGAKISGNQIIGVNPTDAETYGVTLRGDIQGTQVQTNSVTNVNLGLWVRPGNGAPQTCPSASDISFNQIVSTSTAVKNDCSGLVDASPNWWGSFTGPAAGTIGGQVMVSPWCGDESCTEAASVSAAASAALSAGGEVSLPQANLSATLGGSGSANVTLAQYAANPETGAGSLIGTGNTFYDVQVTNVTGSATATLTVVLTNASAGDVLRYWDGSAWSTVIGNGGTIPVAGSDGKLTVVFGPNSRPALTELTGTPLVASGPEALGVQFAGASTGTPAPATVGAPITATVVAKSTDLYGVDVTLGFDASKLEVTGITLGGDLKADSVGSNVVDSTGGTIHFAFSQQAGAPAQSGDEIQLATITFLPKAGASGTSSVSLTAATFSDPDGMTLGVYPATLEYDSTLASVNIQTLPTLGGTVTLQGRTNHAGVLVSLLQGTSAVRQANTGTAGSFSWVDVPAGTFSAKAAFPGYLSAQTTETLVLTAGDSKVLPAVKLLGGDATRDQAINIQDVTFIAYRFGITNAQADINGDGTVNIQDLVLAAANFDKTGPQTWPLP